MPKDKVTLITFTEEQFNLTHAFFHSLVDRGAVSLDEIKTAMGLILCPSCPRRESCKVRDDVVKHANMIRDLAEGKVAVA